MFEIGEVVIYNQYICKIKNINYNDLTKSQCYIMNPVDDNSLNITVPVENKMGKIRKIMNKKEAEEFIKIIPNIKPLDINDKYIEQKYKELINNGNKEDLIKIIKTSYLRNDNRKNNNKKISEIDNNYFNKIEKLLYTELKYSLNIDYESIKQYITDYCSKNIK